MLIVANEFRREPEELIQAELKAVERVLRSGWWVLGDEVRAFEQAWARQVGTSHAIGVGNGLDAIEIALRALGIGPGDEVITTPVTAFATTLAIQRCGALPVFADIDPSTGCLSAQSAKTCVNSRTKAILVVHLYGRAADLDELKALCDEYSIALVEDCAQAHGCRHRGLNVGSIGQFGACSFYPTKNLGAIGDAGSLTTEDPELARVAQRLRNYGQKDRYHHEFSGLNSRLDELQAALLSVRLIWLDNWTKRRQEIAAQYRSRIRNPLLEALAQERASDSHVHHLYVLRTQNREAVRSFLNSKGISTLIHYPILSNEQSAITDYRIAPLGISNAYQHCATCFSLPIHPFLTDDEVDYIIDACNNIPEQAGRK